MLANIWTHIFSMKGTFAFIRRKDHKTCISFIVTANQLRGQFHDSSIYIYIYNRALTFDRPSVQYKTISLWEEKDIIVFVYKVDKRNKKWLRHWRIEGLLSIILYYAHNLHDSLLLALDLRKNMKHFQLAPVTMTISLVYMFSKLKVTIPINLIG